MAATDWIKVRKNLREDPRTLAISAQLGIPVNHVVGCLHQVWSWFDDHTYEGVAHGVTSEWLDRYVGVDGFSKQMSDVNWLLIDILSLSIPDFHKHVSESAKARAKHQVAQKKYMTRVSEGKVIPKKRQKKDTLSEKPAKPELWLAVRDEWKLADQTPQQCRRISKTYRELAAKGCKSKEDLIEAKRMYQKEWPGIECTPEAMVKHYEKFRALILQKSKYGWLYRLGYDPEAYPGLKILDELADKHDGQLTPVEFQTAAEQCHGNNEELLERFKDVIAGRAAI